MAALGAPRAPDETLSSWLGAGPIRMSVWLPRRSSPETYAAYCPACFMRSNRGKRWYSRSGWGDPRCVVCAVHGLPLIRCAAPPVRLRSPFLAPGLRRELHILGRWITDWKLKSPASAGGILFCSPCMEDQVLRALAPDHPSSLSVESFWLSHWRLRMEGWPLPPSPHGRLSYQLSLMPAQSDRLALIATVQHICAGLLGERRYRWPPLTIDEDSFCRFHDVLTQRWPHCGSRLHFHLKSGRG